MWKFEADNIGRVSHAEISMAPLVLLVGRNNTGKSYIATLLWALTNAQTLIARDDARERRPDWYKEFAAKLNKREPAQIRITEGLANEAISYFNFELAQHGREFLKDVFAYDGFERTDVRVDADSPFVPFTIAVPGVDSDGPDRRRRVYWFTIDSDDGVTKLLIKIPPGSAGEPRADDRILTELIYRVLLGPDKNHQAIYMPAAQKTLYVPAARTGLMLSLRAVIRQTLRQDTSQSTRLPRPLEEFLQLLTDGVPPSASQEGEIAAWLENEIVRGTINASDDEIPSFTYVPANTKMSVPLHAASSMITELAPFLILLRQDPIPGQIIFEEPEAHLHLSAQRSMARALARLVNSGVNVLVTTHSDTFVQQINNLMHLFDHPRRLELMQELGYEDADLINPKHAKAYEFSDNGETTKVSEVRKEPGGFVVSSLNDTLVNLARETIALHEDVE